MEVTKAYRLNQWSMLIQERIKSGLTVKDWCEENNISKDSYYSWQRKIRKLVAENMNAKGSCPEWAEMPVRLTENSLAVTGPARDGSLAHDGLMLEASGIKIYISSATDMKLLANVCRALAAL